jgi:catalase
MQDRVVQYWTNVDADLGAAVAGKLGRPAPATAGATA